MEEFDTFILCRATELKRGWSSENAQIKTSISTSLKQKNYLIMPKHILDVDLFFNAYPATESLKFLK